MNDKVRPVGANQVELTLDATKVEPTAKVMGEFAKQLEGNIKEMDEVIVPLLRVYLDDVRGVRMAITSEVRDIMRSTQEMSSLTKITNDLREFIVTVELLKKTLTPEVVEMLRKMTRE